MGESTSSVLAGSGGGIVSAVRRRVNSRGKNAFVGTCQPLARVLDVGCGHNSPAQFKAVKPRAYYVGLDITDCRQSTDPRGIADEYVITTPEDFADAIARMPGRFDAVISAHNLEHCDEPEQTLRAMCRALAPGGRMFLAFPTEAAVNFPSRSGCLNFHDDPTHQATPPQFRAVLATLADEGVQVTFAARRYRPLLKALQGLVLEPLSALQGRVMPGTWALYGFETVIWARRPV